MQGRLFIVAFVAAALTGCTHVGIGGDSITVVSQSQIHSALDSSYTVDLTAHNGYTIAQITGLM